MTDPVRTVLELGDMPPSRPEHTGLRVRRIVFKPEEVQRGESYGLQYRERILHGPHWAAVASIDTGAALFFAWHPEVKWEGYALSRARVWWQTMLHPQPHDPQINALHDMEA